MNDQRICKHCHTSFIIDEADQAFYAKMDVPYPDLCPQDRFRFCMLRRNATKYYKRICDGTGKSIISIHSPEAVNPVYSIDYWYSDAWDGLSYGREYDFTRGFWDQFGELLRAIPLPHMNAVSMENSNYANESIYVKDSYLLVYSAKCENCFYSCYILGSQFCSDCFVVDDCRWCYDVVYGEHCNEVLFSEFVRNCSSSWYLFDCRGCSDCIACVGLVSGKYCILNQPVTPEYYNEVLAVLRRTNQLPDAIRTEYESLCMKHPRNYMIGVNNENVSGNDISNSKNVHDSFYMRSSKDCRYCWDVFHSNDCYDVVQWGDPMELCYFSLDVGDSAYNVRFSDSIYTSSDIDYSLLLQNCHHCFLCAGLRYKDYCIFNKQYTKEEYETTKKRIIEHMKQEGVWGEFFPPSLSSFAYNESFAQHHFYQTKEETLAFGWRWKDVLDEVKIPEGVPLLYGKDLPIVSGEIPNDLLQSVIICESTGKPFRFIAQELDFYRKMSLCLPHFHPDERMRLHNTKTNPLKLWDRQCSKCGMNIRSSYSPERLEMVYCEACYLESVY